MMTSELPPLVLPKEGEIAREAFIREVCQPGSVRFPGVQSARDPILGTMIRYTPVPQTRLSQPMHSGSMFEAVSPRRGYYFIAPDWPSESLSARHLSRSREIQRQQVQPQFNPLNDYVIPLLERRRSCDSRLNNALASARQTPTHARSTRMFPPTMSRDEPQRRQTPSASPFYKSMLASEVLGSRSLKREVTCPAIKY